MKIVTSDKSKIAILLNAAAAQPDLVNEIRLDVHDLFNVLLNLGDENQITNIAADQQWPQAVDPSMIVVSDADKVIRSDAIIYLFLNGQVENVRFLDFGCGEGHVAAAAASKGAKMSVGYDIVDSPAWETYPQQSSSLFTTDFSVVQNSGPYDAILAYDVLDHATDPVAALQQMSSVLAPEGKIYIRFHPWCSRHGGHLYRTLNKAYVHLFVSDAIAVKLAGSDPPVQKVIHPQMTYNHWIKSANLVTASKDVVNEQVEDFFQQQDKAAVIKTLWKSSPFPEFASGKVFPIGPMAMQFLDYVVVKPA